MGGIFGHEVVPIFRLKHLRRALFGTLLKIVIGLEDRLVLRGAEDATAAMCRIAETER